MAEVIDVERMTYIHVTSPRVLCADADVSTIAFLSEASFVEFVVDAVRDVSFGVLPGPLPHPTTPAPASPASASVVPRLILLAISDDSNCSLMVYIVQDNNNNNNDDDISRLIVERRLQMQTDRLNITLNGLPVWSHIMDELHTTTTDTTTITTTTTTTTTFNYNNKPLFLSTKQPSGSTEPRAKKSNNPMYIAPCAERQRRLVT